MLFVYLVQVNIFVNDVPIPFNMKIGDAGEAFFVFETDEDIPDDLATSPLLTATSTTPLEDIPPVALNAKSPPIGGPPRTQARSDILELAMSQDQSWTRRQRVQSASEAPSSDDVTDSTRLLQRGRSRCAKR